MRYLPLSDADRSDMLGAIGASSIDELFRDVPEAARLKDGIAGLPNHASELSVERQLTAMARKIWLPARRRSSSAAGPIATMSRQASTTSSSAASS